jgi:YD repeat-containing protein
MSRTMGRAADARVGSPNAYGEMASYVAGTGGTMHFSEVVDTASSPRDQLGRIVTRVEQNGGAPITWEYSYDLRGRLTDVFKDGVLDEHYEYDANGNRTMLQTLSSSVVGTYDAQDRLLTYGSLSYAYTANGELSSKTDASTSETTLYTHDVRGNLVRSDLPSGDVIEYLVDGQDRRVGKKRNGALERAWLYRDGLNPVAELDGTGALVSRFVYASRPNVPEYVVRAGVTYRILSDHLGSPRVIVDVASGAAVWRAEYDAWGNRTVTLGAEDFVPFGFAGGIYDVDTRLVRFGARDYDANTWALANSGPSDLSSKVPERLSLRPREPRQLGRPYWDGGRGQCLSPNFALHAVPSVVLRRMESVRANVQGQCGRPVLMYRCHVLVLRVYSKGLS